MLEGIGIGVHPPVSVVVVVGVVGVGRNWYWCTPPVSVVVVVVGVVGVGRNWYWCTPPCKCCCSFRCCRCWKELVLVYTPL